MPQRIVAAADIGRPDPEGDAFNEHITKSALALAIQGNAEPHLVHVFNAAASATGGVIGLEAPLSGALYDVLQRIHKVSFTALADAHGLPKERRHLLMGSTAEAVLDRIPCDVLAVKPAGTAELLAQNLVQPHWR